MGKWTAVIIAVLKLVADIFSAKKVADAKQSGKAEAVLESINSARRSIEAARAIEAQSKARHEADATDAAFDQRYRRD